jgi:hypothetical protein
MLVKFLRTFGRGRPPNTFFEILKLAEVFQWGPAQQKAFEELKQYS